MIDPRHELELFFLDHHRPIVHRGSDDLPLVGEPPYVGSSAQAVLAKILMADAPAERLTLDVRHDVVEEAVLLRRSRGEAPELVQIRSDLPGRTYYANPLGLASP